MRTGKNGPCCLSPFPVFTDVKPISRSSQPEPRVSAKVAKVSSNQGRMRREELPVMRELQDGHSLFLPSLPLSLIAAAWTLP
jgi:hypothetical protein